jgi:hypothetical protein
MVEILSSGNFLTANGDGGRQELVKQLTTKIVDL